MMRVLLCVLLLMFALPTIADSYLCISEKKAGFDVSDYWKEKQFSAGTKYIIRKVGTDDGLPSWVGQYALWNHELGQYLALCPDGFDETGLLRCGKFEFNSVTRKFAAHSYGSYLLGTDAWLDLDAYIELGTCSKI